MNLILENRPTYFRNETSDAEALFEMDRNPAVSISLEQTINGY
jgi:hypothetical protein